MVAIFTYEMGAKFTGWVAENEEKAKEFLGNMYGRWCGDKFVPSYNEGAFFFKEVVLVDPDTQKKNNRNLDGSIRKD